MNLYRLLENVCTELRDAWRGLRRDTSFTALAVIIVAAMLTANMTLFAFLDAYFYRPLPIAGAERHFELEVRDEQGLAQRQWPLPEAERFIAAHAAEGSAALESAYAFAARRVLVGTDAPQRSYVEVVTPSYFEVLKPRLAAGRTPQPGEPAILLSPAGSKRLFAGEAHPLGRTLLVDGFTFTVVGVLREGEGGLEPVTPDFWMLAGAADRRDARANLYSIAGVLRPGITPLQAATVFSADAQWLASAAGEAGRPGARHHAVVTLRPTYLREARELQPLALSLLLLFGLVTLVAGANLTSLHLARATARRRDLAIRSALGASRARLVRHMVAESLLVAGAAALVAWALTLGGIAALQGAVFTLVRDAGMSMRPIDVDARVVAAMFVLAAAVGLGCGLVPAWQSTRGAIEGALKRDALWLGGRVSAGRLRGALVVLQVAFSLPLLIGSGILVRSAADATRVDVGYEIDRLIDLRADPPSPQLLERLRALPGVSSASASGFTPLTGPLRRVAARVGSSAAPVSANRVDDRYFATTGIAVTQGRAFRAEEAARRAPVAIISEFAAQTLFPRANPLGLVIDLPHDEREGKYVRHEIVGVAADVVNGFFFQGRDASAVYTPGNLANGLGDILVRMDAAGPAQLARLQAACAASGSYCEPYTLRRVLAQQRVPFLVGSQIASALGLLALGLACLGLHGLARFAVVQRTREFGVRFALGATRAQIASQVLAESLRRLGWGLAVGLPVSAALSALLAASVPFLDSFNAAAYLLVPAALLTCALLAAMLPAMRAANIDPIAAIREE